MTKVLLVTTFWDVVPYDVAVERETQLIEDDACFGSWSRNGVKVLRLDYSVPHSAFQVLHQLVNMTPIHEMGSPGSLNQRSAEDRVGTRECGDNIRAMMRVRNSDGSLNGQRHIYENIPGTGIDLEGVRRNFEAYRQQWTRALEDRRRKDEQDSQQISDEQEEVLAGLRRKEAEYREEAERLAAERITGDEKRRIELNRYKHKLYKMHRCISRDFSRNYPCDRCDFPIKRYSHYFRKFFLALLEH